MTEGTSAGWGSGSMVIGGAILLILLFGIFGGNFFNGGVGRGVVAAEALGGCGVGLNGVGCAVYSATDRDLWKAHCDTLQNQASDTAALQASVASLSSRTDLQTASVLDALKTGEINALRDSLNQERAQGLAKEAKIDNMQTQFFTLQQFNSVASDLCNIKNILGTKLSTPPFYPQGTFAQGCPTQCCC